MNLSKKIIEELQRILKEDFKTETTVAEASEIASNLVGYFDSLLKITNNNHGINK